MSYNQFYKNLGERAERSYPSIACCNDLNWEYLISPLELKLPKSIRDQAESAIRAFYAVTRTEKYRKALGQISPLPHQPENRSVLMAYDFHTTESGDCFLVEINTNASGYLIANLMEMNHQDGSPENSAAIDDLLKSFREEMASLEAANKKLSISIVDDDVEQQKMHVEFLMYRDFFEKQGWSSEICEASALKIENGELNAASGRKTNFIYNRLTDFYLSESSHTDLREAFDKNLAVVSPNPFEYHLLADKQRLVQFTEPDFLNSIGATSEQKTAIQKVLLPTYDLNSFTSPDEIWSQRKTLFFKPKRSFGGKSVYRGESVSRKVFERLLNEDVLIQKFQPAQKFPTEDSRSVLNNWKFDLRFFVYADRIQQVAARIYQGQVTNFSSPMGGFTLVEFV